MFLKLDTKYINKILIDNDRAKNKELVSFHTYSIDVFTHLPIFGATREHLMSALLPLFISGLLGS